MTELHVLWRSMGQDPSSVCEAQLFECFEAGQEAKITDVHPSQHIYKTAPKTRERSWLNLIL